MARRLNKDQNKAEAQSRGRGPETKISEDPEVPNLSAPAMLHTSGRSAALEPALQTPADKGTTGKLAAAMTPGKKIVGPKIDGNLRIGHNTPGKEDNLANPTWLQINKVACTIDLFRSFGSNPGHFAGSFLWAHLTTLNRESDALFSLQIVYFSLILFSRWPSITP